MGSGTMSVSADSAKGRVRICVRAMRATLRIGGSQRVALVVGAPVGSGRRCDRRSPVTPDVEAVASQGAEYVDQVEQIGSPVAADAVSRLYGGDSRFDGEAVPSQWYAGRTSSPGRSQTARASRKRSPAPGCRARRSTWAPPTFGRNSARRVRLLGLRELRLRKVRDLATPQSGAYYSVGTRVSSPAARRHHRLPWHVGLYAGPNLQIDSPRPGKTIQFRAIWQRIRSTCGFPASPLVARGRLAPSRNCGSRRAYFEN